MTQGLELRPVVSRAENSEGHRLTQILFQDVTEEASGHRRARAWALAVLAAMEEERQRIAHELHDEALQLVVELRRQVERAARSAPGAEDQLNDARALADAVIGELRTVAIRLRPPDLDDLGLMASLERLVAEAGRRGTAVELQADKDTTPLPPATALAFYRVAQEALTHAEHHGHASHVTLRLSLKPDAISLQIQDDGIGFDVKRADSEADQGHQGAGRDARADADHRRDTTGLLGSRAGNHRHRNRGALKASTAAGSPCLAAARVRAGNLRDRGGSGCPACRRLVPWPWPGPEDDVVCYRTVKVPVMPFWAWPGTGQR